MSHDTLKLSDEKILPKAREVLTEPLPLEAAGYVCTTDNLYDALLGVAHKRGTLQAVCTDGLGMADPETIRGYLNDQLRIEDLPDDRVARSAETPACSSDSRGCLCWDKGFNGVAILRYLTPCAPPALIACTIRGQQGGTWALCTGLKSYRTRYTFESAEHGAFTVDLAVCRTYTTAKRTQRMKRRRTGLIYILIHLDVTPRQARRLYRRRFGFESSYRCAGQVRGWTTSPNAAYRFLDHVEFHFAECLAVLTVLDFGKITETRFFGFICHLTYAPATLRRRLKNLVSVGSPPPFSAFAKLQLRWLLTQIPRRGRRWLDTKRFQLTRFARFLRRALERHSAAVNEIVAVAAPRL